MARIAFLALLIGCPSKPAAPPAPLGPSVGYTEIEAVDPLTSKPLKAMVFYPPKVPGKGSTTVGPYLLEAEELPIAAWKYPLILLSHGHKGGRMGHHGLAEHLARNEYIVAAVEHAGDSWNDQSAFGTDRAMLGRAYQASAIIDAVLADATLGPRVDPARIGTAGFSAGGYTSLLLVGAQPDFARHKPYCERHPDDDEICDVEYQQTIASPKPTVDPRVRSAFVMAPLGVFFGPKAFAQVRAPVHLAYAEKDRVLLPEENALPIKANLRTLAGVTAIPRADHYVFLSPCTSELTSLASHLCEDPDGVDRRAIHAQLNRDAKSFFDRTLVE